MDREHVFGEGAGGMCGAEGAAYIIRAAERWDVKILVDTIYFGVVQ